MKRIHYYIEIVVRRGNGSEKNIFGTDAKNIDEAWKERIEIEKRYPKAAILESTVRSFVR